MKIRSIQLENFRIYKGVNTLEFIPNDKKNVSIISGENGFGKTTLLTGLVWCLYGKLMVDVDEKYKREINESGGYKRYAHNNLNRATKTATRYSVSILLSDIFIPSIPCQEVKITRTYDLEKNDDNVKILIDGSLNELTKQVGPEIFIHDFILPKEVAKFFFFDAEKIVSLAEMKSLDDKRKLSRAYSEVLGIKKYVDLKYNLEDLRLRFKRNSASQKDKQKLELLQKESQKLSGLVDFNKEQISILTEEKDAKKKTSEQYQEKLIREGNSLSVEELLDLKKLKEKLSNENKKIRIKLKELLELAPFAIAGNIMQKAWAQVNTEFHSKSNYIASDVLKEKISSITNKLNNTELKGFNLGTDTKSTLSKAISKYILEEFLSRNNEGKALLDQSDVEHNEFNAIWDNLRYSYSNTFKQLVKEERTNRVAFNKILRKIINAESKENDLLIREIRNQKDIVDQRIKEIEGKIATANQEIGGYQREISTLARQISELTKKVQLEEMDLEKDKAAQKIIENLEKYIVQLKKEKKGVLEKRIKTELNQLMHKEDFVHKVEVEISNDLIDINLFDQYDKTILKESLSKGEQQLYATSILKALVDESNIKFPIFIDSPLQKFDKRHSTNIIKEFYPNVSEQVVLFPLLIKELNIEEYKGLLPRINSVVLIKNVDYDSSTFEKIDPKTLLETYNEHIYAH